MTPSRSRRRVVLVAVIAGVVGVIAAYRRREIARNADEFHARYG